MSSTTTTLRMPVQITHEQAQSVLKQLSASLANQDNAVDLCIDAADLAQFDSSAIAVLLELKRYAVQHNKNWQLLHAPESLSTLTNLYGMGELLTIAS